MEDKTGDPLIGAPEHQQRLQQPEQQPEQQQQQTIAEEQRQLLHSLTTPAWNTADKIVKKEPKEEKDDSGVSPDHFTGNLASPSEHSSSTTNNNSSPISVTSQDSGSNAMDCNFDTNCNSTIQYTSNSASLNEFPKVEKVEDQIKEEPMPDVESNNAKSTNEIPVIPQENFQCPICGFTTINRLPFAEHLTAHCAAKGEAPDYVKAVLNELMATPSSNASEDGGNSASSPPGEKSEPEEIDDLNMRVPRLNAQGKMKTFRCKHCDFAAITKLEFWDHSRIHIRAERLLTCPKCAFVTEYKHHLEYHLRNHFGSKPYKCDKCPYTCVNKSMLNSHLKSHSNIYQYRCSNCSYATKYCHSLKLHLRKYSHSPAMVLNLDGSPNPLPIIDVYGTRRGPKQKAPAPAPKTQGEPMQVASNQQVAGLAQMTMPSQISPILPLNFMSAASVATINGGANNENPHEESSASDMNYQNVSDANIDNADGIRVDTDVVASTSTDVVAGSSFEVVASTSTGIGATVSEALFPVETIPGIVRDYLQSEDEISRKRYLAMHYNILAAYVNSVGNRERLPMQEVKERSMNDPSSGSNENYPSDTLAQASRSWNSPLSLESHNRKSPSANAKMPVPLDLSKSEAESVQPHCSSSTGNNGGSSTRGTSRRKGKAIRLDRRVILNDDSDEENIEEKNEIIEAQSFSPCASSSPSSLNTSRASPGIQGNSSQYQNNSRPEQSNDGSHFHCQYCDIAFGNVVMYTVHMGYHDYRYPFACNMCGHRCNDKVSFFLHIARSEHI